MKYYTITIDSYNLHWAPSLSALEFRSSPTLSGWSSKTENEEKSRSSPKLAETCGHCNWLATWWVKSKQSTINMNIRDSAPRCIVNWAGISWSESRYGLNLVLTIWGLLKYVERADRFHNKQIKFQSLLALFPDSIGLHRTIEPCGELENFVKTARLGFQNRKAAA